jgi:hypothetical protein
MYILQRGLPLEDFYDVLGEKFVGYVVEVVATIIKMKS